MNRQTHGHGARGVRFLFALWGRRGQSLILSIFLLVTVVQLFIVIRWGRDETRREEEAIQSISRLMTDARVLASRAREAKARAEQQALARARESVETSPPPSSDSRQLLIAMLRRWWTWSSVAPSIVETPRSCTPRSPRQDLLLASSSTAVTVEGPDYGGGIVRWKFPVEAEGSEEELFCVFGHMKRPARVEQEGGKMVVSCQSPPYVHVLEQGESLRSIAATYSMTADEILKLNVNIGDPNKVFLGQRIRLSEERAPMFLAHPRLLASSRHYYKYLSLVLESIRPHSSLIAGGAMLTLQGSGFVSSHETCMTVCSFGGTRVAAKVLSSSEMLCLAPPRWQVFALQGSSADPRDGGCAGEVSCGQAAVEVSINGRDLTRSGLFLTYSRAPLCVLPMLEEGKLISRYRLFTSRVVLPVWSSSPSEKELESMRRSIQRWRILRGVADVALVALNSSLPSLLGLDGVHVIRQDPSSEADQAGGRSSLEEEAILLRRLVCMGLNDMDGKGEEQADYLTAASPFALLNVDFSVALSSLQAEGGNFSLIGRAPPRPLDHQSESENNSGDASARSKAVSASSVDFVAFPYSTVQSICKAETSLRSPLDLLRNEWTRLVDGSSSVSVEVGHGLQGFLGKTDPTSGTQPGKPRASMLDYANWVLRNC